MSDLVSIVITTLNREARLLSCLNKIIQNTDYRPYEIIIGIDKGDDDYRYLEYFEDNNFGYERFFVKRFEERKDYVKGIYDLSSEVEGKYLVYFNDDQEPAPRWLSIGMKEMYKRLNGDGLIGFWDGVSEQIGQNHATIGLIPTYLFKLWDASCYNHYYIDTELSYRAKKLGKFYKSKSAMVVHYHQIIRAKNDSVYKESVNKYAKSDAELYSKRIQQIDRGEI
jgi:GT2 family glycosyltransferase